MDFSSLQKGDWQNFLYLGLILMVLLAGVLSRRDISLAKILKYFAAWSLIGFIAVALYAYRFEFSDFKSRILGEINPTTAIVGENSQIIVNLAQDGHFYLDAKINGKIVRFMIDTGASDITLNLDEAKRIGIDPEKLSFSKPYQTANGTSWGASITLDEIEIANRKFYNIAASVNSSDMGTSLLGMNFLRQFRKYEFYRDHLVLEI